MILIVLIYRILRGLSLLFIVEIGCKTTIRVPLSEKTLTKKTLILT